MPSINTPPSVDSITPSGTEYKKASLSPAILFIIMMVSQGCTSKRDDAESPQKPQPSKISLQCDPLYAKNVTDEQLAMYGEQLPHYFYGNNLCRCVSALLEIGIEPEELSKYLTDKQCIWSIDDVYPLAKAGITHEQAKKYNKNSKRLRGQIIVELIKANVTPEQTQEYLDIVDMTDSADREVGTTSFMALATHKIPPEQIKHYTNRFSGIQIYHFIKDGIPPEQALAYPKKLKALTITTLIKAGIDPERTRNYPEAFNTTDIYQLASKNITPETVKKYPPYMASKIIELIEAGVSPEAAQKQYDADHAEE